MSGWIFLFFFLLLMPICVAWIYYKSRQGHTLEIRQGYVKDVRYFGRSFSEMVEKALPEMKGEILNLSRPESVLDIGKEQVFTEPSISKLIIVKNHSFCPEGKDLEFAKEIYCVKDAIFTGGNYTLRAVYSKRRILLGYGTAIARWADAEGAVVVYDNCDLGRRVSSGEQLVIGFGVKFSSLYAPRIFLGRHPQEPDLYMEGRSPEIFRLSVIKDYIYNNNYINDDFLSEEGTVPNTVITNTDLKIVDDIVIQGDIHSDGSVYVMERAVVVGNLFAEKDVLLAKGSTVLGSIFTQGNVFLEEGACVGQPHKIVSIVARGKIQFSKNNYVFGFILAERGGETLPNEDSCDEESRHSYSFPEEIKDFKALKFKTLDEYENVDENGFRLYDNIREVEIPAGARTIPNSQFFSCKNLERVRLPITVSSIGAYAFADCCKVDMEWDLFKLHLTYVGTSAFENCHKLKFSNFPDALQTIENAAFANCKALNELVFTKNSRLKKIGDHAFRECINLKKIYLPDGVESVGISAFRDCLSLKEISVSERISEQPGISEIVKNCPNVSILFRPIEKNGR